jgi:EamA domain-containing membrane protein RarD
MKYLLSLLLGMFPIFFIVITWIPLDEYLTTNIIWSYVWFALLVFAICMIYIELKD